jgi:threonyl-tRNA synthetase
LEVKIGGAFSVEPNPKFLE